SQPLQAMVMLISACSDNQVSYDLGTNGVFTDALKKTWNNGAFTGGHAEFRQRIQSNCARFQYPNLYWNGLSSDAFLARKPFTLTNVSWKSAGGALSGDPVAVTGSDFTHHVAVAGEGSVLQWWRKDVLGSDPIWQALKKTTLRPPALWLTPTGGLGVVIQATDGVLWSSQYEGRSWGDFVSVKSKAAQEYAIVVDSNGCLNIFMRSQDNALWNTRQVSSKQNVWEEWTARSGAGSLTSGPSAALNAAGRVEVVVRGPGNQVFRTAELGPGKWDSWYMLEGELAGAPVMARQADRRLMVFGVGPTGTLRVTTQTIAATLWTGWTDLGGRLASQPVVGTNRDGRVEVFARGVDGNLHHRWQTSVNGPWSPWEVLFGAIAGAPTVTNRQDGGLVVFARGTDGKLIWTNQIRPNGPDWIY
ncbi:MAG TPA: hypothetical protein PLA94_17500, partial [Myxococcota bacterium]|nr:hypothetical protein [Myxococcota bacterium]